MKLVPHNRNIVCKCISPNEITTSTGLVYKSNNIPEYEVVAIPDEKESKVNFKLGDIVISNSTGTKIEIDGVEYFIFNIENIIGKTI